MSSNKIQYLPPEDGHMCDSCHTLVHFKMRTSKKCAAYPGKRIVYLYCPVCGHHAVQMRLEGVENPSKAK